MNMKYTLITEFGGILPQDIKDKSLKINSVIVGENIIQCDLNNELTEQEITEIYKIVYAKRYDEKAEFAKAVDKNDFIAKKLGLK